jgi:predicted TIM-barrel fold metal-dependent hydrolase
MCNRWFSNSSRFSHPNRYLYHTARNAYVSFPRSHFSTGVRVTPPLITLEEAFLSKAANEALPDLYRSLAGNLGVSERLKDTDKLRLGSMDDNGISLQILSHVPGLLSAEVCKAANDEVAAAVSANPTRLAGFANLPVADPGASVAELRRCVKDLGPRFVGALIDNRADATYYDGEAYMQLWREAQDLDVPIYLHPTLPSEAQKSASYTGNFSHEAATCIGAFAWGWHSDVAVHILRLYAAGVFDLFPKLKIIIGHFGEMLPFMLDRVDRVAVRWGRKRGFREVYDENIWITTSGVWSVDPMATIIRNVSCALSFLCCSAEPYFETKITHELRNNICALSPYCN